MSGEPDFRIQPDFRIHRDRDGLESRRVIAQMIDVIQIQQAPLEG